VERWMMKMMTCMKEKLVMKVKVDRLMFLWVMMDRRDCHLEMKVMKEQMDAVRMEKEMWRDLDRVMMTMVVTGWWCLE
jgi:hypothetical protein